MASKTVESSLAQTSSDVLYCKWGSISFNNLMQEYDIRPEWNPVLPSKQDTTFSLKKGKITLFSDFFKFCNFRLPITKFCKSVLEEYQIHISQMHPLGLVKLRHIEFACIALGHIPEIWVFRVFFVLVWKSPLFTFDRRDIGVSCLRTSLLWREMGPKEKFKDEGPPSAAYIENALFKKLNQRPSECTIIPEGALVMVGMSKWSMFDFDEPPRNAALISADRVIEEQEPDVLRIHLEQFLLPAVPADPMFTFRSLPQRREQFSYCRNKETNSGKDNQ
ncbi:hypothetical protein Hanom_Chr10g00927701 [Helianthus anomalus]